MLKTVQAKLEKKDKDKLSEIAKKEGYTVSSLIRKLVIKYIKKRG